MDNAIGREPGSAGLTSRTRITKSHHRHPSGHTRNLHYLGSLPTRRTKNAGTVTAIHYNHRHGKTAQSHAPAHGPAAQLRHLRNRRSPRRQRPAAPRRLPADSRLGTDARPPPLPGRPPAHHRPTHLNPGRSNRFPDNHAPRRRRTSEPDAHRLRQPMVPTELQHPLHHLPQPPEDVLPAVALRYRSRHPRHPAAPTSAARGRRFQNAVEPRPPHRLTPGA